MHALNYNQLTPNGCKLTISNPNKILRFNWLVLISKPAILVYNRAIQLISHGPEYKLLYVEEDILMMMVNLIYPHHEISRIMTAAVVSRHFREDLLNNPRHAIENGYGEETFALEEEQTQHLEKIRAISLEDFAAQVILLT